MSFCLKVTSAAFSPSQRGKGLKFYCLATEGVGRGTELSPTGNVPLKMFCRTSQVSPGQGIVQGFLRRRKPEMPELKGCLMSSLKELMVVLKGLLHPAQNPCGVLLEFKGGCTG